MVKFIGSKLLGIALKLKQFQDRVNSVCYIFVVVFFYLEFRRM